MSANLEAEADDPFDAFGKEETTEDEEEGKQAVAYHNQDRRSSRVDNRRSRNGRRRRDPECGVLAHHRGTESALLQFVLSRLSEDEDNYAKAAYPDSGAAAERIVSRCEKILALIDEFCMERHWMMHVGDEKGRILEEFLGERLNLKRTHQLMPTSASSDSLSFCILELGTYCGYSLIRMVKTVLQRRPDLVLDLPPKLRIFTIDVSAEYSRIAQRLARLALSGLALEDCVTFGVQKAGADGFEGLIQTLESLDDRKQKRILDFVFIDHDKDSYLPDLLELESDGRITSSTFVAADNVIFFRLSHYRDHMQDLASRGLARTRLILSRLEYSGGEREHGNAPAEEGRTPGPAPDLLDGLELTEYL